MGYKELVFQYPILVSILATFGAAFVARYTLKAIWHLGDVIEFAVRSAVLREIRAEKLATESSVNELTRNLKDARRTLYLLIKHLDLQSKDPSVVKMHAYMREETGPNGCYALSFGWDSKNGKAIESTMLARVPFYDEVYIFISSREQCRTR